MPTKKNFIKKSVAPKSLFDDCSKGVDSTISFNQGDFIVLDTSAHLLKAVASGDLGTKFVGMSRVSISSGKPLSPIQGTDVDASQGTPALAGPVYGVTVSALLKSGDTLHFGDPVYLDGASGTRNITATQAMGAVAIGSYQGPTITASGATEVEVLIGQTLTSGTVAMY